TLNHPTPALPVIGTAKIQTLFKLTTLFCKKIKVFCLSLFEVSYCFCLAKSSSALLNYSRFSVGQR
ncbi:MULTISPECIES: hypothetical protein, partial [unclassified Chryseobacterium]|uniref:hypothetical protein n=1 Tax=unclassified Chryseobacterium TaxID=2593645 RepID=UPI002853646C